METVDFQTSLCLARLPASISSPPSTNREPRRSITVIGHRRSLN